MGAILGMSDMAAYVVLGVAALSVASIVVLIVTLCKVKKLRNRIDVLTRGKDTETMEDIILNFFERIESLEQAKERMEQDIENIQKNLQITYQKMGLVKYDAFREMSGALSYSLALLDKDNNGVLISSMYSREGCYTYAKDVVNGKCALNLSEEEEEALKQAVAK
jgi:vacuolar-type H+-ATPase subunit D/Vma8